MKIGIYYFSGTGNTKFVAELIKEITSKKDKKNISVDIYDISKNPKYDNNLDLLIIGGPIYAGNMPEKVIKWIIHNIPENTKNTKALVYTTSAGLLNAYGVDSISSKLKKKNFEIIGKECFEMPRNFYFGSYVENSTDEIGNMIFKAKHQVINLIETYIDKELEDLQELEISHKGILLKDLLAELFSVMAKFMGKSYKADDKCIQCGKCVKNCPQSNIKLGEKGTIYGNNCMMCTKCIHICPVGAISYKGKYYNQYKMFI